MTMHNFFNKSANFSIQTHKNLNVAVTTYFGSGYYLPKKEKTQIGLKDAWLSGHSCSDTNI